MISSWNQISCQFLPLDGTHKCVPEQRCWKNPERILKESWKNPCRCKTHGMTIRNKKKQKKRGCYWASSATDRSCRQGAAPGIISFSTILKNPEKNPEKSCKKSQTMDATVEIAGGYFKSEIDPAPYATGDPGDPGDPGDLQNIKKIPENGRETSWEEREKKNPTKDQTRRAAKVTKGHQKVKRDLTQCGNRAQLQTNRSPNNRYLEKSLKILNLNETKVNDPLPTKRPSKVVHKVTRPRPLTYTI